MSLCSLQTHEFYTFKPVWTVRHNLIRTICHKPFRALYHKPFRALYHKPFRALRHKPTHSVGMLKQPIQIFVHKLAYEQKSASAAFSKSGFATFRLMAL